jgi:competence protein ComEA
MKRLFAKALAAACVLVIVASALLAAAAVDINTASQKDLEALKGVGPATAKKIIAGRPYASVDGLSKAGLSAKLIADLKPLVTVSATAAPAPSAAAKPAPVPSVTKAAPKAVAAPSGPVDINTASQKDLEALKGVGPATATKIIAGRPYPSVDALSKAGLSAKLIADLKPHVVASTPAPAPALKTTVSTTKVAPVPATPAPAPAPKTATVTTSTAAVTTTTTTAKTVSTSKVASTKLAPGQTVNINTASKEQLDALPEIGPVKAQAIIDGRPYAKIEDVMKVKGIKQATFDKIKNLITVH